MQVNNAKANILSQKETHENFRGKNLCFLESVRNQMQVNITVVTSVQFTAVDKDIDRKLPIGSFTEELFRKHQGN